MCDHLLSIVKVTPCKNEPGLYWNVQRCTKCGIHFVNKEYYEDNEYQDVHHMFFSEMMNAISDFFKKDKNKYD